MSKNNEKQILTYADWAELGGPTFMGTLNATVVRGKEIFAFEYNETWLKKHNTLYQVFRLTKIQHKLSKHWANLR